MNTNNVRFHIGQSAVGYEPLTSKPPKAYIYSDDHRDDGAFATPEELEREIARRSAAGLPVGVHRRALERFREAVG